MSRAARFILKTIRYTTWVVVGVVLAGWFVGRILTDRFLWSQWLWWIPTPVALAAVALGLAAAILPRGKKRRKTVGFAVWSISTVAVAIYFGAIEHRLWRGDSASTNGLRIAHWNLTHPPKRHNDAYAGGVLTLDADIIVLTSPNQVPRVDRVREHFSPGASLHNLGIFQVISRVPLLGSRTIHAQDRIYIALAEFDTQEALGRSIIAYLVDLPSEPEIAKYELARSVREALDRAEAPAPDIVIGDFNMTRGSASIAAMFPELRFAYTDAGHGYAATYPREWPLYHIDHMLLGASVRAVDYDVVDPGVGRHRAQEATIVMTGESADH